MAKRMKMAASATPPALGSGEMTERESEIIGRIVNAIHLARRTPDTSPAVVANAAIHELIAECSNHNSPRSKDMVVRKTLIAAMAYLEKVQPTENGRPIYDVVAAITEALTSHPTFLGDIPRLGRIDFDLISNIWQSYWSGCREKREHVQAHSGTHNRHPFFQQIRMNDIPFAESVFCQLMALDAPLHGLVLRIEETPWREVALGLMTNRLDVAIYNGSLAGQLMELRSRFAPTLLYRSEPLYQYDGFPVLRCRNPKSHVKKLCIPALDDFEKVVRENSIGNRLEVGGTPIDLKSEVVYCDTGDQALEHLVDGSSQYALTGALQAHYGEYMFRKQIEVVRMLRRKTADDGNVYFWVVAERRDEAQNTIRLMTAMWNNFVAKKWSVLGLESSSTNAERLITLINSQPHRAFVSQFGALKRLVDDHDRFVDKLVEDNCVHLGPI